MVPTQHDTPFSEGIIVEEFLSHFWPLQFREHTGASDPEDHLYYFKNVSLLHQYSNGVKCQVLLITLVGLAQR